MHITIEDLIHVQQPYRTDQLLSVLKRYGFVWRNTNGSHIVYHHPVFPDIRNTMVRNSANLCNPQQVGKDCAKVVAKREAVTAAALQKSPKQACAVQVNTVPSFDCDPETGRSVADVFNELSDTLLERYDLVLAADANGPVVLTSETVPGHKTAKPVGPSPAAIAQLREVLDLRETIELLGNHGYGGEFHVAEGRTVVWHNAYNLGMTFTDDMSAERQNEIIDQLVERAVAADAAAEGIIELLTKTTLGTISVEKTDDSMTFKYSPPGMVPGHNVCKTTPGGKLTSSQLRGACDWMAVQTMGVLSNLKLLRTFGLVVEQTGRDRLWLGSLADPTMRFEINIPAALIDHRPGEFTKPHDGEPLLDPAFRSRFDETLFAIEDATHRLSKYMKILLPEVAALNERFIKTKAAMVHAGIGFGELRLEYGTSGKVKVRHAILGEATYRTNCVIVGGTGLHLPRASELKTLETMLAKVRDWNRQREAPVSPCVKLPAASPYTYPSLRSLAL